MLTASVKRAEDDLAAARRRNLELKAFGSDVTGQIDELNLEADTTAKSVRQAVKEKEDKMVAHDVLKLEVKRLRDLLNSRADQAGSIPPSSTSCFRSSVESCSVNSLYSSDNK